MMDVPTSLMHFFYNFGFTYVNVTLYVLDRYDITPYSLVFTYVLLHSGILTGRNLF